MRLQVIGGVTFSWYVKSNVVNTRSISTVVDVTCLNYTGRL